MMTALLNDVRYGFRQLWKNPGFTLVMILVLSVGIGVSVGLFSYMEWRLHPPSPFSDPQRVVHLSVVNEERESDELTYLDFLGLREQLPSLSGLAAVRYESVILKKDQWSREYEAAEVSRNFFSVAGVHALLGTVFSQRDSDELCRQPGVILSHRLWKSQFGSDSAIVGRSIELDGVSRVVWGVAPVWFHSIAFRFEHGPTIDFWLPVEAGAHPEDCTFEGLIGRLKPGVSLPALRAETESAFRRMELRNPESLAPLRAVVQSDPQYRNAEGYPPVALCGIGIGCAFLLIACFNVSGSLLAKAEARRMEMAVRQALGGGHARLMRQLFTEGVLFASLALGASLLVSYWLMRLLLASSDAGVLSAHFLNPRVALFSLAITLAGTLLFEFFPVRHICQTSPIAALKADRSERVRRGRRRYGFSTLVVLQLAITLALTYGAGLMFRSYLKAGAIDLGFQRKDVLLARLQVPGNRDRSQVFFGDLASHVRLLPGVKNVGLGLWAPTDGRRDRKEYDVSLGGDNTRRDNYRRTIAANTVTPGYFPAAGIPILKGRNFSEQTGPSDTREVIINETFASRFWPDQDPVGRFVQWVDADGRRPLTATAQVVGMVRDVRRRERSNSPEPYLYVPLGQAFSDEMTLLVETQGDPLLLADPIRQIVERLDSRVPVYPMTTLARETQNQIRGHAADATLMGSLSLLGMAMAGIGLYGIVAFAVTRRTHELGVRMALGARSQDVLRAVMGQRLKLSLVGLATGLIGSFLLGQVLRASLLGTGAFDLLAFAGSSLVLSGAALLACYIPARRAARIDPMTALRCE
jgi:putative ABC transport system permease protein